MTIFPQIAKWYRTLLNAPPSPRTPESSTRDAYASPIGISVHIKNLSFALLFPFHHPPFFSPPQTFVLSSSPRTCAHLAPTYASTAASMQHPQNSCRPMYAPPWASTMAPAMGLPVSPPKLMTAMAVPVRVPIWRMSLICAMSGVMRLTKPPDAKPKRAVNTTMAAEEWEAGIQRASVTTVESVVIRMMTLKRPSLSAAMPGRMRPKMLRGRKRVRWESCAVRGVW